MANAAQVQITMADSITRLVKYEAKMALNIGRLPGWESPEYIFQPATDDQLRGMLSASTRLARSLLQNGFDEMSAKLVLRSELIMAELVNRELAASYEQAIRDRLMADEATRD